FHLPDNFRFPYAAIGFSDFWRRWHISLSTWLRDYLYVPLGGNRHGNLRTYANLMITMLLGGLWHGANWTFVVWGGLHGLYLAVERMLRARFGSVRLGAAALFGLALLTWFFVNIAWVFFRAPTFTLAFAMLRAMFGGSADPVPVLAAVHVLWTSLIVGGIFAVHWLMRDRTVAGVLARVPGWLVAVGVGSLLLAVILEQGTGDAFIYFQF
ncbi:MAG TPA: MBOAT family O-acyltransferase, partial [Xanthomonadales bacterium]|nr:MBOAT family O-acyltransferase [Xanthomonadales bacterium]